MSHLGNDKSTRFGAASCLEDMNNLARRWSITNNGSRWSITRIDHYAL